MHLYELVMVALGLSMDAFAVALCKGLSMKKLNYRSAATTAAFFGVFQAGMPLMGWLLGRQFERYITKFDHWIAFALLIFIGGKMLKESFQKEDSQFIIWEKRVNLKELFVLSIATSIDALAVGITFAFLQVSILPSVLLIGCTTLILSFVGVILGNRFGIQYKSKAQIAGGVALILIGIKILLEHLGVL